MHISFDHWCSGGFLCGPLGTQSHHSHTSLHTHMNTYTHILTHTHTHTTELICTSTSSERMPDADQSNSFISSVYRGNFSWMVPGYLHIYVCTYVDMRGWRQNKYSLCALLINCNGIFNQSLVCLFRNRCPTRTFSVH